VNLVPQTGMCNQVSLHTICILSLNEVPQDSWVYYCYTGNVHSGDSADYMHTIIHSGFPRPNKSTTATKEPVFLLWGAWLFCGWQGVCEPCTTEGNVHSGQFAHYMHTITHSWFPRPNKSTTAAKEPVCLLLGAWLFCGWQGVCESCTTDGNVHSGDSAHFMQTITHSGFPRPNKSRTATKETVLSASGCVLVLWRAGDV